METTLISNISRQVSLVSFPTGMFVVLMTVRISFVHNLDVPFSTVYNYVCTHDNYIKIIRSQALLLSLSLYFLSLTLSLSLSLSICLYLFMRNTHVFLFFSFFYFCLIFYRLFWRESQSAWNEGRGGGNSYGNREQGTGNREHRVFPKCSRNMFPEHSEKIHPWERMAEKYWSAKTGFFILKKPSRFKSKKPVLIWF